MIKLGVILFILGVALTIYLINVKFNKTFIKRAGIVISILISIYGLILSLQPADDNYIKFTKTTISQDENKRLGK